MKATWIVGLVAGALISGSVALATDVAPAGAGGKATPSKLTAKNKVSHRASKRTLSKSKVRTSRHLRRHHSRHSAARAKAKAALAAKANA